jgi:RES domain-containing protein
LEHSANAFDGRGAKLSGGRWNSAGKGVVYTAAAASQALLEMLVHADATIISLSYVLIPVTFDEKLVTILDRNILPNDWRVNQLSTRRLGDAWLDSAKSVILSVPSAILDVDQNFLINLTHPDMKQLTMGSPQPLTIDARIKAIYAKV